MRNLLLAGIAGAALLATIDSSAQAATVTVADVGTILNESDALPAEATPGLGISFAQYFTFTLPEREVVTASISDSAQGSERVVGGILSLNNWTSTGGSPLFIPAGSLIDSSPFVNTVGGQDATVGPDILAAGKYFAEVSGTSGASAIKLAIDGTVTAGAVPEASTWAMLIIGLAFLGFVARSKQTNNNRFAV